MIGAHPDDCDLGGGGTAIIYAKMGYAVKFVSVTNGDAGHQTLKGVELAKRRFAETQEAAKRFGVVYDVLDNHDGELLPTLEVRLQIIKKIREWNADIVIAPRPNDYHPDHRYTGVLVQDAAYMVAVPNVAPETPALKKNPVFLYFQDRFKRPNPFRPDVVVDISDVYAQKIHAIDAHESQVYEWLPWIGHYEKDVPGNKEDREKWLAKSEAVTITPDVRISMEKWYGEEKAAKVKHVEAFEVCEYGAQPDERELKRLFPMLETKR
jgi:LmbE family N-acetylglucosaminyl deacetylase